jgi:hypothetical protein
VPPPPTPSSALIRLQHDPLPCFADQRFFRADVPESALEAVRRIASPDRQDLVDRFHEHGIAVLVQIAQDFLVRAQPPRTDAKQESSLQHMIDHRHIRSDHGRVVVRQIDGPAA